MSFLDPRHAPEDEARALPGDDVLPAAKAQATHHIDIDAPPDRIWPWLVQMGCRRGGWYSYDQLDNAGVASADHIVPELQNLAVGDLLPMRPDDPGGVAVLVLDAPRTMVLGTPLPPPGEPTPPGPRATWAFALEPIGGDATRLFVRVRAEYEPTLAATLLSPIVRVMHEIMERKQLRTLKQRAEAGD